MKFPKDLLTIFTILVFFFSFPKLSFAAVEVKASELQEAQSMLWPGSGSMGNLDGFSDFQLIESSSISGGISATYEARLLDDPWTDNELPHLKLTLYAYESQEAAHNAFSEILDASKDTSEDALGDKKVINSDEHYLFYSTETGESVDFFDSIDAEYRSYHLLHVNGNILYQASIYRPDEGTEIAAAEAYADAIKNPAETYEILYSSLDTLKFASGLLFPPANSELIANSEISSLNLSELYTVPQHGEVAFDLYIGEAKGAVGTILDSSGIDNPKEGDIYLYIDDSGRLFAGIYAPSLDSDCNLQGGWYRIESDATLQSYEWNNVRLHYGVGGLMLYLNDKLTASCNVSQPRSESALFFGDYPYDSINESMIGYLDNLDIRYSKTDSGLVWDTILSDQLFLDLPNTDPDLMIFQALKERGVFVGSDGMLYPDKALNRAEIVKVLLKTEDLKSDDESPSVFSDVPDDAWYLKYINKALDIGIIKGYENGQFIPEGTLNRAEFFTMLLRLRKEDLFYNEEFRDVKSKDWYAEAAAFASKYNLVKGMNFYPSAKMTRREAAKVIYTLMK